MVTRPHVRIEVQKLGEGTVTGPVQSVFVNGEEWAVTSIETKHLPGELCDIKIGFLGSVEIEATQ
jgi:hypothetical protein